MLADVISSKTGEHLARTSLRTDMHVGGSFLLPSASPTRRIVTIDQIRHDRGPTIWVSPRPTR
jgi:hypothetical protein